MREGDLAVVHLQNHQTISQIDSETSTNEPPEEKDAKQIVTTPRGGTSRSSLHECPASPTSTCKNSDQVDRRNGIRAADRSVDEETYVDHNKATDSDGIRQRQRNMSYASQRTARSRRWSECTENSDLPWSKRMKHVTWAFFTLTMATGGIANVLHNGTKKVPFQFPGLYTIGLIITLTNIVLYLGLWAMMITRFVLFPHMFLNSLTHPTESLFVPAFAVSFGTILINIVEYGDRAGDWLLEAVLVLFWIDCALSVILSITIYMILWSTTSFTIAQMTPIWIFPAYPLLIVGPHAANLSSRLRSPERAIEVIIGGFTVQGIGFLVGLTIYSAFVYRLMTQKLPTERLRPGMFVSVGPSAFTVSGTIGMARNLPRTIGNRELFMDVPGLLASQVLRLVANWMSLWLWGLSLWFFFVSLLSNIQCFQKEHRVPFAMTWFSFVFPQTALCTATFAIAQAFDVQAIRILGCVMTVLLVIVWLFVIVMMIRAIIRRDILWPERGEDRVEGGFRRRKGKKDDDEEEGSFDDLSDVEAGADTPGGRSRDDLPSQGSHRKEDQ